MDLALSSLHGAMHGGAADVDVGGLSCSAASSKSSS